MREDNAGHIHTTVVPALSDFRAGSSDWWLTAPAPGQTRIRFDYRIQPDFWIPPLLGTLLIKSLLRREAQRTIDTLEALARG